MSFEELRWDNLSAAWGFGAVAAVVLGYVWLGVWKRRLLRRVGDSSLLARMAESVSGRRQRIKAALVIVASALLVVAVMRPKYGVREGGVTNAGIDIAVALDVSKSMLVRDVVPDRLTGAKLEVTGLLERLHGGRMALVPFAGIPFVQCPLTSDFDVVRAYLDELKVSDMPVPGTAVARALKQAIAVLTAEDVKPELEETGVEVKQFQGSKYRAILLFTDGEDHEGEVATVAAEAAEAGIRIFTVGVGSAAGNVVPILADDGSEIGYMKAADGKTPLISGLNEALLKEIAEATDGAYFHFGQRSVVSDLYAQIDGLEKKEFDARFQKLGEDRFQVVLFPALVLLLLEWLLGDRRRRGGGILAGWLRRRPLAAGSAVSGLVALLAAIALVGAPRPVEAQEPDMRSSSAPSQPWYMTTNGHVDDGNAALQRGEAGGAIEAYGLAKAKVPENPILHFDFGLAYLAAGQWDKAVESFGRALDGAPKELEIAFRYAQATANAHWGNALEKAQETESEALDKWKAAAEAYEHIIVLDPTNEDAKWNLELALLRVEPPCDKRNDEFEPNDTPAEATALELAPDEKKDLLEAKRPVRLCPGDTDYFGLQVNPGDRLSLEVKLTSEDPDLGPDDPRARVALLGADGTTVLAELDIPGEIPERLMEAQGGVLIRLANATEDELDVQLSAQVRPPCASKEDDREDNDGHMSASVLPQDETARLRICPEDDDWFEAFLGEGDSLFAFANAEGDHAEGFDMELTDPTGRVLARSAQSKGSRIAALLQPGAGRYLIRVTAGGKAEAPYELTWKVLPPCPEGNDPLEPNDVPADAKDQAAVAEAAAKLPAVAPQPGAPGNAPQGAAGGQPQNITALLRICVDDVDYFRVTSKPDDPKVAQILFDHEKGNLALELLDAAGNEVLQTSDQSAPGTSAEAVGLPKVEEETDYLLRVKGAPGEQNFYVLKLTTPPPPQQGDDKQEQPEQDEKDDADEQDEEEQPPKKDQEPKEQPQDPVEDAMEQLDRNPENLEALEALRRSPMRNVDPEKDW